MRLNPSKAAHWAAKTIALGAATPLVLYAVYCKKGGKTLYLALIPSHLAVIGAVLLLWHESDGFIPWDGRWWLWLAESTAYYGWLPPGLTAPLALWALWGLFTGLWWWGTRNPERVTRAMAKITSKPVTGDDIDPEPAQNGPQEG